MSKSRGNENERGGGGGGGGGKRRGEEERRERASPTSVAEPLCGGQPLGRQWFGVDGFHQVLAGGRRRVDHFEAEQRLGEGGVWQRRVGGDGGGGDGRGAQAGGEGGCGGRGRVLLLAPLLTEHVLQHLSALDQSRQGHPGRGEGDSGEVRWAGGGGGEVGRRRRRGR